MQSRSLLQEVSSNIQSFLHHSSYHLLLACSGGADSTALLLLLYKLQASFQYTLSVVTVNHNIREENESAADAAFVCDLCKKYTLPCYVETLPPLAVAQCAAKRKRGVEDAARFLRYQALELRAAAVHADFILTAHNRNDVYETVLMRLFQGAGPGALKKMAMRRGKYVRPLITVDRMRLEAFLAEEGIVWREDSTNAHDVYLRNRIRHFVFPALTAAFGAWQPGLDKTLCKIQLDAATCDSELQARQKAFAAQQISGSLAGAHWQRGKLQSLSLSSAFFYTLPASFRLRMLERACILLRVQERVPSGILLRMAAMERREQVIDAGPLLLEHRGPTLFLFDKRVYQALYCRKEYCIVVSSCGSYPYPLGAFSVYKKDNGCFCKDIDDAGEGIGPLQMPFMIRGRRSGDRIQMKSGGLKIVKKIFNEWAMDSLSRALLPIIVEHNGVRALYGSPLGYRNWIVEASM
ncbi:MAG: tRNA lysidine(34) synthetase TilS [Treponema sp.]